METTSLDERRVEEYLSPLRRLSPAPAARVERRGLRSLLVAVVAGVAVLAVGGAAVAGVILVRQATPNRSPVTVASGLPCSRLVGTDAGGAAALLARRGQHPSWRLTRYVDPAKNGGVIGYAAAVDAPPPGTVVEDVTTSGGELVIFVRERNDAHAPPLRSGRC